MKNMSKPNPEACDDENPQLTAEEMRRARPAREVFGAARLNRLLGRPRKEHKKVSTTLRIDPDVLDAFKEAGKGWQSRINDTLREHMPRRGK